jgi:hypothetical protein
MSQLSSGFNAKAEKLSAKINNRNKFAANPQETCGCFEVTGRGEGCGRR